MSTIKINGVSKVFGKVTALDGINLEIKEGTIYGLLGRNGAGKSTLMNVLSGRMQYSSGSITIDGTEIAQNDAALGKIHMMGEQLLYTPTKKVSDMFKTAALFYPEYDMEYALKLCVEYKLDPKKKLNKLSTGYRSIAKIINALATNAPVVIFDEPVLGLDANHRDMFYRQLTEKYAETNATYIISTHIIEEVTSIIERAVIIKEGKLIMDEETDTIRTMGFAVSGKADAVDAFTKGKNIIGEDMLGGLKSAYIMGSVGNDVPPALDIQPLSVQNLFIHLTNS